MCFQDNVPLLQILYVSAEHHSNSNSPMYLEGISPDPTCAGHVSAEHYSIPTMPCAPGQHHPNLTMSHVSPEHHSSHNHCRASLCSQLLLSLQNITHTKSRPRIVNFLHCFLQIARLLCLLAAGLLCIWHSIK